MNQIFINKINIIKVHHLKDVEIPISETSRKHLILTGKNGSGKTSVIEALEKFFMYLISSSFNLEKYIGVDLTYNNDKFFKLYTTKNIIRSDKVRYNIEKPSLESLLKAICICDYYELRNRYHQGNFILACYHAHRDSKNEIATSIEKITFSPKYKPNEKPGKKLVKYMVAKKATQAFALQKGDLAKSQEIEDWFFRFESILKKIFDDKDLKLDFNIETFEFSILQTGHEPFDFNTMSDGYSAVFDIINDLIMRTEKKGATVEGIVLIDEIETHLHLELQKSILPFLTEMFPNIQFIVTTHSPFILNSINDAVIFDLENKTLVKDGMGDLPYEGIVEGYFGADRLSHELRTKFERYKELSAKEKLTDADWAEMGNLETYLEEIPDYLAIDITSEYSRLKLENENK